MIGSSVRRAAPLAFLCFALCWLATTAAIAATPAAPPRDGFLLELAPAADGRLHVQRLVADAGPPPPRAHRAGDWELRLIDGAGGELGRWAVADPQDRAGHAFATATLRLRFPDHAQAVLVEVRDDSGRLRAEVPLDAGARAGAVAARAAIGRRLAAAQPTPRAPERAARAAALRQLAAAGAERERLRRDCARLPPAVRVPERIVAASGCAPLAVAPPTLRRPPAGVVRARAALRPPMPAAARAPATLTAREPAFVANVAGARRAAPRPRRPKALVAISGRVTFPGETPPTEGFWLYIYGADGNPESSLSRSVEPPLFAYSLDAETGTRFTVLADSPVPFLKHNAQLGPFAAASTTADLALARGAVLTGRLLYSPLNPPQTTGGVTLWSGDSTGYGWSAQPDADNVFRFAIGPGANPTLAIDAGLPYLGRDVVLGPITADTSRDFAMEPGVPLDAWASGPGDGSASVSVMDFVQATVRRYGVSWTNNVQLVLRAHGSAAEAYANGTRGSPPLLPAGELAIGEYAFELEELPATANVGLTLRDSHARPLHRARVEAWRDGRFVVSTLTDQGVAELRLADGNYRLQVWPDSEEAAGDLDQRVKLFATPAIVVDVAAGPTRQDLALDASPAAWVDLNVRLPDHAPWPACPNAGPGSWERLPFGRLELLRDGVVVARSAFRGYYYATNRLQPMAIGGGQWRLRYQGPGGKSWTSEPFVASEGREVALIADSSVPARAWRGTLRDHLGNPVANRDIGVSDEMGITVYPTCPARTNAAGQFALPLCEGCAYEFRAAPESPAQRRIVRIREPVVADRVEDLALGAPLAFSALPVGGTGRVFGAADAPFRLVFLAEGYAQQQETFTDGNGNGVWDGVQFIDVDGDGVWDGGEPFARYGNAPAPVAGVDPRAGNEAFADANGDGVLSLDDGALFERNVQDYLRGLFSNHQFAQYRGAYQARARLAYSAQAGMDHPGVQSRDTLFGSAYVVDRGLIEIDYAAASVAAAEVDPGYTAVVVMINQPVLYGRVNAFILASGGVLAGDVNDTVSGHEFGHNPGGLADEYSEFPGEYFGLSPYSFHNSTRFVQPGAVAWGGHVPAAHAGRPTRPWMAADGFYEGASYYASGAFRPSPSSMMRFMDSLLFNTASVDRLRRVHTDALRGRPGLLAAAASCRRLEIAWDASGSGAAAVRVHADDPEGTVLAKGGTLGAASAKPGAVDLYLVDAADGRVLDVEAAPSPRCTQ